MDVNNSSRLKHILSKRMENMEVLREFDPLFRQFAAETLKNVIVQVNDELERSTGDSLKVFYDDPYGHKRSYYYALVQLFESGRPAYSVFLDDTRNNPSLKFEGLQDSAEVRVSIKLQNEDEFRAYSQVGIKSLNEGLTASLLIDFIEKIYNR